MDWLRQISLLRGPLPWSLGFAALTTLVFVVARPDRRWLTRTVPTVTLATALSVAFVARVADIPRRLDSPIPKSFYVWATLPLLATVLAFAGWPRATRGRRRASIAAVPLLAMFSASLVNHQYAYVPTAADLLGLPLRHEHQTLPVATRASAVLRADIPARASGFHHRSAVIWLPPAALDPSGAPLPVVVMLAGTPGATDNLIRAAAVDRVAERYAASHDGAAPIMVFPDHNGSFLGDTECVDGPRGNAETYLTVDVPAFISERFRVSTGPRHWAVAGFSEGGTCAVTLALRHPDLFGTFVDISGDPQPRLGRGASMFRTTVRRLYGGDGSQWASHDPASILGTKSFPGTAGLFAAGTSDHQPLRAARALYAAASNAGIDARLVTGRGGHDFEFVHATLARTFGWMADRISAADPAAPMS